MRNCATRKHFQGRPTPVYHARTLSLENGGAQIYLKREDLNHTGAHKLNHCMGEGLLAKYLGKKKVIAETGAGQHGVALATAAAHFGLECEIHMGQVDIEKQAPNVSRMQLLGATVVPVTHGLRTLKEAVDSAFEAYMADYENSIYCIGSVVGPHPFPLMVRDFQRVVGIEAMERRVFEIKEHLAAIGLGLLPAYSFFWRTPLVVEQAVTRRNLTWILAGLVWWNFLVGHILNNIKGLFS